MSEPTAPRANRQREAQIRQLAHRALAAILRGHEEQGSLEEAWGGVLGAFLRGAAYGFTHDKTGMPEAELMMIERHAPETAAMALDFNDRLERMMTSDPAYQLARPKPGPPIRATKQRDGSWAFFDAGTGRAITDKEEQRERGILPPDPTPQEVRAPLRVVQGEVSDEGRPDGIS